jgi:hypothetical protein
MQKSALTLQRRRQPRKLVFIVCVFAFSSILLASHALPRSSTSFAQHLLSLHAHTSHHLTHNWEGRAYAYTPEKKENNKDKIMVEPLVSVSAATGAAAKALGYVALRSHDGRRVILPVAAAAGSRVLHGLFQGLSVMQLHRGAGTADSNNGKGEDDVNASPMHSLPQQTANAGEGVPASSGHAVVESIPVIDDDEEAGEGATYHSYAATFPAQVLCQPPSSAATVPRYAAPLLEVPIRSLETSTLARVAEFLVVKGTLASHPHHLHDTDVFGDLDRTSERDQLTAMQVLLGADFLNC